jgi:hypothetical protein
VCSAFAARNYGRKFVQADAMTTREPPLKKASEGPHLKRKKMRSNHRRDDRH